MERETKIEGFEIFSTDSKWRGRVGVFSTIGEIEGRESENFHADINLPVENYDVAPNQIKKEIFEKFKNTFTEILEWLKSQSV